MASDRRPRRRVNHPPLYGTFGRVLLIDADLNKRLAAELRRRGRQAHAVSEFLPEGTLDPDILRYASATFVDAVLVTGDDAMPWEHGDVVAETKATIAVIAPGHPHDPNEDAREREIVHRWAHRIQDQATGTVRRYHLTGPVRWTPRRR